MNFKITISLFLIFLSQLNIFLQQKEVFLRKISKLQNNKDLKMMSIFNKQLVAKSSIFRILIKKISKIFKNFSDKSFNFVKILKIKFDFISNSKQISTFYFNSIKPNWFGCCWSIKCSV